MWTIAASNKKIDGPLGSYNGLTDVHLAHYFSTPAKQSHLKTIKLISADGKIIPEQKVTVESLKFEKRKKMYDILAKKVIQTAAHKGGSWNKKLCNYLDNISKMENVKNIKIPNRILRDMPPEFDNYRPCEKCGQRNKDISTPPRSAPTISESHIGNPTFLSSFPKAKSCSSAKVSSPYIVPLLMCSSYKNMSQTTFHQVIKSHKRKRKKKHGKKSAKSANNNLEYTTSSYSLKLSTPHQILSLDQCKVTILFHGRSTFNHLQCNIVEEILIKQQHCGGTPVTVYKGEIAPKGTASFFSLTHEGFTFSLTIFLGGLRYLKLSSCCIFRYPLKKRLGGAGGYFSIQNIEGGKPCWKCHYQRAVSDRNNFKEDELTNEDEINDLKNSVDFTEKNEEQKMDNVNSVSRDTEDSISEGEGIEQSIQSKVSTNVNDEVEENLSEKSDLQDTESDDQILEEHHSQEASINSGESNNDSESSISSAIESINVKSENLQIDSSSDDENGKQHTILASIHGSPS